MRLIAGGFALMLLAACESTPENDAKWHAFANALAAGAAGGAAYSSGQNYAPAYRAPASDYEWDWDQFYHGNVLVWACRGVQTGQFANDTNCAYKARYDFRWPDKWLR